MTSGCALASRCVPNGQRTFRRKAALFCLFRATIPVAASCVWASRTLNHQRTSSALFRRLSVRLLSHSCLGRTTTRYFWWHSFHELRRAMRFVPKAFSGASNRLSTGVRSGQLGAKRSCLREWPPSCDGNILHDSRSARMLASGHTTRSSAQALGTIPFASRLAWSIEVGRARSGP